MRTDTRPDHLRDSAAGKHAFCIAAGPSLGNALPTLGAYAPELRERAVIIAVQTALKPLLTFGCRPHFVTALDWHPDLSLKFYEGLDAAAVEGITLVMDPKAAPSIGRAWPGEVLIGGHDIADLVAVEVEPRARLKMGGTVAHLSYYLARFMGCDPVVLVGQDLGFTDGAYYGAGAAIHQVWSGELDEFRTLEMCEHERVVRMGGLREVPSNGGGTVLCDAQMDTYRAQFEREFAEDGGKGLRVIDTAAGGSRKAGAEVEELGDVVRRVCA